MSFIYLTQFAATYNCNDSSSLAYGTGSYGICGGTSIGAPNTGGFNTLVTGALPSILLPLAVAIILAVIATIVVKHKKRTQ